MIKKIYASIGIFLVLLQIIAFCGLRKSYVGLYPDADDVFYNSLQIISTDQDELTFGKALYAIRIGADRFITSFSDLFADEYEYIPMSHYQITSAYFRESFGCSGNSGVSLLIYDLILTISYYFSGLLGLLLIIVALLIKDPFLVHEKNNLL